LRRTSTTIGSLTRANHMRTSEWSAFAVWSGYADR
jgi:hypothetical protein